MSIINKIQQLINEQETFIIPFSSKQEAEIAYDKAVKKMRHISDSLIKISATGIQFVGNKETKRSIINLFSAFK